MKKYMKKVTFTIISLCLMLSVFTTTNVVVNAKTTPDNGLEIDKTAKDNGDGTYTISLEAYATGTRTTISKAKPTDIVLVLDQSGSMNDQVQKIANYVKVYQDGRDMEMVDGQEQYVVDPSTGKHIMVVKTGEKVTNDTNPYGPMVSVWKDSTGKKFIPLNVNGSSPSPGTSWVTAVQFYRVWYNETGGRKIDALKNAAKEFINNVVKNGGDHRIAVVGFAAGEEFNPDAGEKPWVNTELFIGANQYNYNDISTASKYASAFQSTKSNKATLDASINALETNGSTRADLGLEMANRIINEDKAEDDKNRNKVVVMFTDGEPTSTIGFQDTVANATIAQSKALKGSAVKVYSVGIVDALDPNKNPSESLTGSMNRYMQYVSSNFPNATALNNAGINGNYQAGNFLAATDKESLLKIFEKISEDISSPDVELDGTTVFKDVVSEYFALGSALDVKTYTSKCTGKDANGFTWGAKQEVTDLPIAISDDMKTIDVTGFNYKEKFVAINDQTGVAQGEKLIVDVVVSKSDGFLGGDGVNTNEDTAGIYADGTIFEAFPEPKVNVALNYNIQANDKSVYVGSIATLSSVIDGNAGKEGIQYFGQDNQEYTFDGINNKFVDTIFEIKNKETQELLAKYEIKAGTNELIIIQESAELHFLDATNVEVKANVLSVNNNQNTLMVGKDAKINVFTPTVTVEDSSIFLGETINLNSNIKSVSWSCEDKKAPKPVEAEPTLTYTYTSNGTAIFLPEAYSPSETSRYTAQVFNGLVDITSRSVKTNKTVHNDGDFQVQVITGELVIEKEIDKQSSVNEDVNTEQSFRFKIEVRDEKDGAIRDTYYQSIQFSANEGVTKKAVTLQGLRKGYYTVSEVSSWSWLFNELADQRADNYKGNGTNKGSTENSGVYIGDKTQENTSGKTYFGTATGTVVAGVDQGNPAKTYFKNTKLATSIIADAATAINQFKNR